MKRKPLRTWGFKLFYFSEFPNEKTNRLVAPTLRTESSRKRFEPLNQNVRILSRLPMSACANI